MPRGVQRAPRDGPNAQWRVRLRDQAAQLADLAVSAADEGAPAAWWLEHLAQQPGRPKPDDFALTLMWWQEVRDLADYQMAGLLDAAYKATQASWADLAVVFGYTAGGAHSLRDRFFSPDNPRPFRPRVDRTGKPSAGNAHFLRKKWQVRVDAVRLYRQRQSADLAE